MLQRIKDSAYNPDRLWDLPSSLLLLLALLTASSRLVVTEWTAELSIVQTLTFFGVLTGLAMGYSKFKVQSTVLVSSFYSIFIIMRQLGRQMDEQIAWLERVNSLLGRLRVSLEQLTSNQNVPDPIMFVVFISILFWILALTSGYNLTRSLKPWRALIPAGISIIIINSYDFAHDYIWYLAFYLLVSLLLVARVYYLNQRSGWQAKRFHLPLYIGSDLMRATFAATGIILLAAWAAPAFASGLEPIERAWDKLTEPWREVNEDLSKAFTALDRAAPAKLIVSDYYGDSLELGQGNIYSEKVIMTVNTEVRPSSNIRFYWRSRAYDYFDSFDKGWSINAQFNVTVSPNELDVEYEAYEGRWITAGRVNTFVPLGVVYSAAQPQWISRPSTFRLDFSEEGKADISFIRLKDPIRQGEQYQFAASIANASKSQLRTAGTEYPEWVLNRYLQIPDSTTQRTKDLAAEIARDLDNPYDIADAVTQYLRDNITYSLTVPERPADQDPVDWLLFDHRQGFCNYYATAEIMLLRSLGIPARLGVGYAQGERTLKLGALEVQSPFEEASGRDQAADDVERFETFTVRQKDIHAWPEIYFPGYGWVEFEPTVSQRPIVRPSGIVVEPLIVDIVRTPDQLLDGELPIPDIENLEGEELPRPSVPTPATRLGSLTQILSWVALIIISVLLIGFSIVSWRRLRSDGFQSLPIMVEQGLQRYDLNAPKMLVKWAYFSTLHPVIKAYGEINNALKRLGDAPAPQDTPTQRSEKLQVLLPHLKVPIEVLRDEYQRNVYGQGDGNQKTAVKAGKRIRKGSKSAKLQAIFPWLKFPKPSKANN